MKKHVLSQHVFLNKSAFCMAVGSLFFVTVQVNMAALPIQLESIHIDLHDRAAIQRGARYFKAKCMVCHAMKYLRHDPIALSEGIRIDTMPTENASWSRMPPPDLSLVGQVRGGNWLYTYLHSFYKDTHSPLGTNNLLVPHTSMPNVLQWEQGVYEKVTPYMDNTMGGAIFGRPPAAPRWFNVLKQTQKGHESPEAFHRRVSDIVTFLMYASYPETVNRKKMGMGVCLFLLIFAIPVGALRRMYWKKV